MCLTLVGWVSLDVRFKTRCSISVEMELKAIGCELYMIWKILFNSIWPAESYQLLFEFAIVID